VVRRREACYFEVFVKSEFDYISSSGKKQVPGTPGEKSKKK